MRTRDKIRSYSELRHLYTFEERFDYLKLHGEVGETTFGFDRWMNQQFYRSREWKLVRLEVIARDLGMDLGIEGYEIFDKILIHHMNPMSAEDMEDSNPNNLDPDFLITTTHQTHNAIHYGDANLLVKPLIERHHGDTRMW